MVVPSSATNAAHAALPCGSDGNATLTQRNRFGTGDEVELLTSEGEPVRFTAGPMTDEAGEPIDEAVHPMMVFHLKLPRACAPLSLLRKPK